MNIFKLQHPNKRTVTIAFAVLVLLIIVLSRYVMLSSAVGQVWWLWDDSFYISVAHNLRQGDGFNLDILEYRQIVTQTPSGETVYTYAEYGNVGRPLSFCGPVYPVFLAIVFAISSAHPPDWYTVGALASLAVSILVIAAIYLFALRMFGRNTAVLASVVAALIPALYWYSLRVHPQPLLWLFFILSFIAASEATGAKGWLLVGALAAIGHLTHGSGLLAIASFFLWCLIERRFKDGLFLMTSYIGLMLPWMIRNQLVFNDFTQGLALPVAPILGLFGIELGYDSGLGVGELLARDFGVLQVLSNIYTHLTQLYNMGYIVPLLVILAFFGAYRYQSRRVLVPQFIFLVLSILGYVYLAFLSNRAMPETRYLMGSVFVLLPLSMHGFISLISMPFTKLKTGGQREEANPSLLANITRMGIILLLLGVVAISLVNFITHLYKDWYKPHAEKSEEMQFHEWVRQQDLPEETIALTNAPHVLFLRTGLSSLYLDTNAANFAQIEWVIDRYDVDYVVIYVLQTHSPGALSQLGLLAGDPDIAEIYSTQTIRCYEVGHHSAGHDPSSTPLRRLFGNPIRHSGRSEESLALLRRTPGHRSLLFWSKSGSQLGTLFRPDLATKT